jgi:hypothetical protein
MPNEWIVLTQDETGRFFSPQHADGSLHAFASKHEAIEAGKRT